MKGSPIIATAVTIIVLLGMYLAIRAVILPDSANTAPVDPHAAHGHSHCPDCSDDHGTHGHDHGSHDHGSHDHDHGSHSGSHDDTAVETEFELYFSSIPKSVVISQPSTKKEIINISALDSPEWNGSGVLNLEGHQVELQIDVTWATPGEMNFVQVIAHPDQHASRNATLRNSDNISDIAEFNW